MLFSRWRERGGAANSDHFGVIRRGDAIRCEPCIASDGVLGVKEIGLAVAVIVLTVADDLNRAGVHFFWLSAASAHAVATVPLGREPPVAVAIGDRAVTGRAHAVAAHGVGPARVAARTAVLGVALQIHTSCGAPSGRSSALRW